MEVKRYFEYGLVVTLTDEGNGFDPSKTPKENRGLRAMNERAELAGGTFSVYSSSGKGTRITALLPLDSIKKIK